MLKAGIIADPPLGSREQRTQPWRHWSSRNLLYASLVWTWAAYNLYSCLRLGGYWDSSILESNRTRVPSATRNPAYLIRATHGAVASENELCSNMGISVLKDGGNAVDAAISTTLCIGVVNMFSSGIGGGGFMTVRVPPSNASASSKVYAIDFRETAPALSNKTMYVEDPLSARWGGLAVGVPGELRGLEEAHRRWGKLPWKRLVDPAAQLAAGWKVQNELARRIEMFAPLMLNHPDWKPIFAPEGRLLQPGETIRRTNLSRTLATIAEEGADAFYKGPIADAIVQKIKETGGILTHQDLEDYRVIVKRALQGTYRGRKIYTPHAPTSGPVLIHMLNLMEHYNDLIEEGRTTLNVHRLIEAMKFGFAARTRIGDPAYHDQVERIHEIPTKEYAAEVVVNITDAATHPPEYYHPIYDVVEDHGTSHSVILDNDGMAVSVTSTVNLVFGSAVLDPVTGVILNDEMDDFSTPGMPNAFGLYPSPYNYPGPGKRPLSSTTPVILEHEDGSFFMALGGSGGSRIFPAVFQTILNVDWGMDVSGAIESGRLHDQLFPMMVDADDILPASLLDGLREKGHNITVSDTNRVAAVIQAIVKPNATIYAASDSRKNGIAAGY
ncbi:gamma-glutamyltranspeptidase [Trametes coccinea BRFM310]|uniref:Glutathione hydrolase n=1 Tax=Trametes coccinea (strain BRFM310) TaxID=1353009 RepID=A0A1Y2J2M7_TRAC3|nr:gamma-glutamyltranspeptidase [Trametes coccinea BRFM310]